MAGAEAVTFVFRYVGLQGHLDFLPSGTFTLLRITRDYK
jgi:hypothetical protein